MILEKIDFTQLDKVDISLAWGCGDANSERFFYRNDRYFFKIWSGAYAVKDLIVDDGKYVIHNYNNRLNGLASIDLGFVSSRICSAFVDLIWSDEEHTACVGYVTKLGVPLVEFDQISEGFFYEVCKSSHATGFYYTDLKPENIVQFDGQLSLVDLDTVLSRRSSFNIDFEETYGSLRKHVFRPYRDFILRNLTKECE